jgi:hypothetical protein
MTIVKIILAVLIFVLMALLTSRSFFPTYSKYFFAGGSIDSLMEFASSNMLLQIFLLVANGFALFRLIRGINFKKLMLFILILALWITSGRVIGIFPDGTIKTGWFYFETNEYDVCIDNKTDCQTIAAYQTSAEPKFPWCVLISNKQVRHNIFLGPLIWYPATNLLKKEFGSGQYTK